MLQKLNRETAGINQTYPIKVLQFGDGNFMRGFMDWIIDILNERTNFNGAVQIIRPLRNTKDVRKFEQDGLYHVVERGLLNGKVISNSRLITCVTSAINPYSDFAPFLKSAENPVLQIILSNTTEAGITFSTNDKSIYSIPESFPGKATLLLYHRYNFFNKDINKGVVFIPCELIEKNGDSLRAVILQYIDSWNLPNDFKEWVITCNTFCNTLVDRIVPGFPTTDAMAIQQSIGYEDTELVVVEPYYALIMEAPEHVRTIFPAEQAGLNVKFVRDITPYRLSKVRILNGAHTALVPIAYLRGLRTVKESIHDPYVNEFLLTTIHEEILPTLDLPEKELKKFAADVIERFQNPFIRHELMSISLNSISKFKVRVLPTILAYEKRTGKLPERLLQSLAALIVFYKGNWRGESIPLRDSPEVLSFFKEAWNTKDVDGVVQKVLANIAFWDRDLTKIKGMQEQVNLKVNEIIHH